MDNQAGTVGHPYKQSKSTSASQRRPTKETPLNSQDMRSFSVRGPYNFNISLSNILPGDFSISFPQSRRAASEPIGDSEAPRRNISAQYTMSISEEEVGALAAIIVKFIDDRQESQQIRAPSPAPTEIDDPEPEAILEDLKRLNIKVRDYAYPEPSLSTSAAPTSSKPSSVYMTTEIFDQYRGIAEFEFRLRQDPRTYPIQGKTLRRLLDLKWVPMDECKQRLHQMDWEAMKDYDARASDYPWRPCKWSNVPDATEREQLLATRGSYFVGVDRARWQLEALEEREARERVLVQKAEERVRIREQKEQAEREMEKAMALPTEALLSEDEEVPECLPSSKKRALERSASTPSYPTNSESPSSCDTAGPKRARLDGQTSVLGHAATKPLPVPPAPPKQYPAPLSSYDPALYPEAASVIEAEARPPLPPREDTPPLDGDSDGENAPASHGHPLQRRRKGLKRTLSRTQTFTQL